MFARPATILPLFGLFVISCGFSQANEPELWPLPERV